MFILLCRLQDILQQLNVMKIRRVLTENVLILLRAEPGGLRG